MSTPKTPIYDLHALAKLVENHITLERILRYLQALADTPAPSTTASLVRAPVLRSLFHQESILEHPNLEFHSNYRNSGNTVILTGPKDQPKDLWYFAHLDVLSYLVQPKHGARYPLVPFGYHLAQEGAQRAEVLRYDLERQRCEIFTTGMLLTCNKKPYFQPTDPTTTVIPGDRIIFRAAMNYNSADHSVTGNLDNAGAVASLAVAAYVLAEANIPAVLGFLDEEEGPKGSGNLMMGRGGFRLLEHFPTPELIIVADMHQAGGKGEKTESSLNIENVTRLGAGAVLAEFSSLGRGSVTPPHLYAYAKQQITTFRDFGVHIQESNNAYTSRSDDVSAMLKTPNVLLLGFPGFNRHFDEGLPQANLIDLVNLSKAMVFYALLVPKLKQVRNYYD